MLRRLSNRVAALLWSGREAKDQMPRQISRGPQTHVIILDGTMSSLSPGEESNAGLTYRLLREMGAGASVYYEAGVQWDHWMQAKDVAMGRGINRQIRRAYGWLATRYHPGDRIFFFGYSRGAYAVRSLAGVIDQVGLLKAEHATERNIMQAYRHYQCQPGGRAQVAFSGAYCHDAVDIEMVGVWDTVKALGVRLPVAWRWSEAEHAFHSHQLGKSIRHGFQALAMDETRSVFQPVLWDCAAGCEGRVEQVWFRGAHGDIGGQLGGFEAARPLANIPFVWMMERAEACGLGLPNGWRARFPCDPNAPSVGTWRGIGKLFLLRARRKIGLDSSERVHPSAQKAPKTGWVGRWSVAKG